MPERTSASVVGRHMMCHASANLELAIPHYVAPVEDRSVKNAANDGTRKHEILAQVFDQSAPDLRDMATVIDYVSALRQTRRFKALVEVSAKAEWLVSKPDTTADLVLYTQDELHILDYKAGAIPVEVIDNKQLLYGAVTYAPLAPKAKGATLHIMQPRGAGCQSWYADTNVLVTFMAEAQAAERAIQGGSVNFHPSNECTFCPANPHARGQKGRPFCPVLMHMHYPPLIDEAAILADL
jgi:hypothetical protein